MINIKKITVLLTLMICFSVKGNTTDVESISDDSTDSISLRTSFFDTQISFIKDVLESMGERKDEDIKKTLKYIKKNNRLRIDDREVVINVLLQRRMINEASEFLWHTLRSLDGCNKDFYNYYQQCIGLDIDTCTEETFRRHVIGFWTNPELEEIKEVTWELPSFESSW